MKAKLLWVIGSLGALTFTSLQGCGDDDEGAGATGGTAGSTGKGGSGKGGSGKGGSGTGGEPAGTGGDPAAGGTPGGGGEPAAGGTPGAGGGGAGYRAGYCSAYCSVYWMNCETDDNNTYTDEDDCNTICVGSTWDIGDPADPSAADTIGCRIYHATAAGYSMADQHCDHSAENPSGSAACQ